MNAPPDVSRPPVAILAYRTGKESFFAAARAAILGQFALVTLASLALIYGLVTRGSRRA